MPLATGDIAGLYCRHACEVKLELNSQACQWVKTDLDGSVASDFCSHIGIVFQAVPATMLQVAQWHMRTRL